MALKLLLSRQEITEHFTMGRLFVDGAYYCDTLEPPVSAEEHPAVVPGTYKVQMYPSKKFRAFRPILTGVLGRSGILIHEGNCRAHTQGCILVGTKCGKGLLSHSMEKLSPLTRWIKDTLKKDIEVEITICNRDI